MLQLLTTARKTGVRVFYAMHHRYRATTRPGSTSRRFKEPVVAKKLRIWKLGWRISAGVCTATGRHRGPGTLVFERLRQHRSGSTVEETCYSKARCCRSYRAHMR
jgi:hypothetical protein